MFDIPNSYPGRIRKPGDVLLTQARLTDRMRDDSHMKSSVNHQSSIINQMEKDIEHYITGLNFLIKKMSDIEDQLLNYGEELAKEKKDFSKLKPVAEENLKRLNANYRIAKGQAASILHRLNNCSMSVEQSKRKVDTIRHESMVLKNGIEESNQTHVKKMSETSKLDRLLRGMSYRGKNMLAEVNETLESSLNAKASTSIDFYNGSIFPREQSSIMADKSGVLETAISMEGRSAYGKSGISENSYLKPMEGFRTESKHLMKEMITLLTKKNKDRVKLMENYLETAQKFDEVFTEIKMTGNDITKEQIIDTLVMNIEKKSDMGRRLMDVEVEIKKHEMLLRKGQENIKAGVEYSRQIERESTQKVETKSKKERKTDHAMTM